MVYFYKINLNVKKSFDYKLCLYLSDFKSGIFIKSVGAWNIKLKNK